MDGRALAILPRGKALAPIPTALVEKILHNTSSVRDVLGFQISRR